MLDCDLATQDPQKREADGRHVPLPPGAAAVISPIGDNSRSTNVYAYLRSRPGARYQSAMPDREPAQLRDPSLDDRALATAKQDTEAPHTNGAAEDPSAGDPDRATGGYLVEAPGDHAVRAAAQDPFDPFEPRPLPPSTGGRSRQAAAVFVAGFWRRLAAAAIDLAAVVPAALIITVIAGRLTGLRMPSNLRLIDIDLWIDLVLATDPALVMALVLFCAIGLVYLLVFQIVVGRTLGMRALRMKIIDVYGDRPSAARCVARCAGYLAGVATLFLGFLWMGFDSEKRGLQDWIAGTYVIRA